MQSSLRERAMPVDTPNQASPLPMRLLCLDPREPSWTSLAMSLESQLGRPLRLRWCDTPALAISLLRGEQFDCIVIACGDCKPGESAGNSASRTVQAIRSIGCDDPVLVLVGAGCEEDLTALAELDCETVRAHWESPALPSWMLRAVRRHETQREHQRLSNRDSRRRSGERSESLLQLQQQREIAERFLPGQAQVRNVIPDKVRDYYLELLRTYVIMGTGNLSADLAHFSQGLAGAGVTVPEAFCLHLDCLSRLIEGLGLQSLRHIVARANLLSAEFLLNMSRHTTADPRTAMLGSYGIDLSDAALPV